MKYVVYEIWVKSRVIEAENDSQAYKMGEPDPAPKQSGLSLSNWHVQKVGK